MKNFLKVIYRFIINIITIPVYLLLIISLIFIFVFNYLKFNNDNVVLNIIKTMIKK